MGNRLHLTGSATTSFFLRLGLAVVFGIFGYGKFIDVTPWIGFIPQWATPYISHSAETFMRGVGVFELALAALLFVGLWVRAVAVLAALHLFGIVLAVGYSDLAVRDFGLFASALALAALGHAQCHLSIDGRRATP